MRPPGRRSPMALLVEDDPAVARMLRIFLRASGFEVTETPQGAEALLVLEQESPDAVVLDLMLPNGQGGAVLDRLRRKDRHNAPALGGDVRPRPSGSVQQVHASAISNTEWDKTGRAETGCHGLRTEGLGFESRRARQHH